MPEPLSPTIGLGMKVAVLPCAWATLWITYFCSCSQSARCTRVLNRVPSSIWPAVATSWWCTSTGMPSDSSRVHICERMSWKLSTGGTGK